MRENFSLSTDSMNFSIFIVSLYSWKNMFFSLKTYELEVLHSSQNFIVGEVCVLTMNSAPSSRFSPISVGPETSAIWE